MSRCTFVVLTVASLGLAACGGGVTDSKKPEPPPPSGPAPVATVGITPSAPSVQAGASVLLLAVLKDAGGATLTDRTVTWSTADTTIAKVSSIGQLTGMAVGQTTVTAASEGKSGTATATVTVAPPQITLDSAYSVGADSAYLWGYVNGWGGSYQMLYHVARNASFTSGDSSGVATGTKSAGWGWTYGDLTASTTYYFRIVARNSAGTTIGPTRSFTTLPPGAPRIDTAYVDSIGPGNMRYVVTGGSNGAATMLTFQYRTFTGSTYLDLSGCDSVQAGTVSHWTWWCRSAGYPGSTQYWYRATARNSAGSATSIPFTFTTLPPALPGLTTLAIDSLTSTSVRVWGSVVPNGADATLYVYWGSAPNNMLILTACTTTIGLVPNSAGCKISNLLPNTTYYYKLSATNSVGTTTGATLSLATLRSSATGAVVAGAAAEVQAVPLAGAARGTGRAGRAPSPVELSRVRTGLTSAPTAAPAPRR